MKTHFYLGETKQYTKFNILNHNRELNNSNLKKIEESILENGLQVPIIVDESYNIIDGQHRFYVLQTNKMVVSYIMSKRANSQDIDKYQESKKWTAWDYCHKRANLGDISCQEAMEIAEEWNKETKGKLLKLRTVELLMDGKGTAGIFNKLKYGKYLINKDYAYEIYELLQLMNELDMGTSAYGQKIIRPLKKLFYENKGLSKRVIEQMTKDYYIRAYSNENDQYEYLKDIYNKTKRKLKL
jgi:hypothetical protein